MADLNKMFRNLNKMILKFDENEFDVFLDEALNDKISSLKNQLSENDNTYKKTESQINKDLDEEELNNQYENLEDISLNGQRIALQLLSINEMRVIHLYKSFELEIINLIKRAYSEEKINEFYKWEYLCNYLKNKDITPLKLSGYKETNELRKVCNHIKHKGSKLDNKIIGIHEFQTLTNLTYTSLESFLNRVKPKVIDYLKSITTEFYNDLYKYDDDRLIKMSNTLKRKMEEKTLKKFIEKLKE